MAKWGWQELYLMQIAFGIRQLVWGKSKDAQKTVPKERPELIAPDFILKAIAEADKKRGAVGKHQHTPNARLFKTTEELDAYLKKPRKEVTQ